MHRQNRYGALTLRRSATRSSIPRKGVDDPFELERWAGSSAKDLLADLQQIKWTICADPGRFRGRATLRVSSLLRILQTVQYGREVCG